MCPREAPGARLLIIGSETISDFTEGSARSGL
jgi:hypothetical protein